MEILKKYKKVIIAIICIMAMLISTKVMAVHTFSPIKDNVQEKSFHPYDAANANRDWMFYCIQKGTAYKVKLPDGWEKDNVFYKCTNSNCDNSNLPFTTRYSMSYEWSSTVDDRKFQDAAYVIASAFYDDKIKENDMEAQYSIWTTSLNSGPYAGKKGLWGQEAEKYKEFYDKIHDNNNEDMYGKKIFDNTKKEEVKVKVNQTKREYIVGPFNITYPKGEENNQIWSFITNISLLDESGNHVGSVLDESIQIVNGDGNPIYIKSPKFWSKEDAEDENDYRIDTWQTGIWEEKDKDKDKHGNFPESDTNFYVKILVNKISNKDIAEMSLEVDFKYLEHCYATLQEYHGKLSTYSWKATGTTENCSKCGRLAYGYKLDVDESNSQNLVAFKKDETENSAKGEALKIYKTAKLGVALNKIDLTMKLSGQVFLDQDNGKVNTGNNLMDGNNEALNGVEVTLYNASNHEKVTQTTNIVQYHQHTDACYEERDHVHKGDPYTGGGCYIKQLHRHTGSPLIEDEADVKAGGPGTCYATPIKSTKPVSTKRQVTVTVNCIEYDCIWSTDPITIDGVNTYTGKHSVKHTIKCGAKETEPESLNGKRVPTGGGGTYVKFKNEHKCTITEEYTLYIENGVHKHTDDCYMKVQHVHTDNCKNENGDIVCGKLTLSEEDGYYRLDGNGNNYDYILICDLKEGQKVTTNTVEGDEIIAWGLSCKEKELWGLDPNEKIGKDKVRICGKDGQQEGKAVTTQLANPILTKNNGKKDGYYEFVGLRPFDENGNPMKYYVKFTYNGMVYTNVDCGDLKLNAADISKAGEEIEREGNETLEIGSTSLDNRTTFNDQFAEIGSYPANYKVKEIMFDENNEKENVYTEVNGKYYNKVFLQEDIVDIFKKISEYMTSEKNGGDIINEKQACRNTYKDLKDTDKYKSNKTELKRMIQFAADCRISAETVKMYPLTEKFTISSKGTEKYPPIYSEEYGKNGNKYKDGKYNQLHVNLGIKARPTFDLKLSKDVLKADVSINGKTETYKYDSRRSSSEYKFGIDEINYLNGLRSAYKDNKNTNSNQTWKIENDSYDLNMRSEEIANGIHSNYDSNKIDVDKKYKEIDKDYELGNDDKLKIFVTYKIAITNESSIPGAITEVVDYYDPNYEFIEAYVGNAIGDKTGDVNKSETSIYGNKTEYKSAKSAYKTIYLTPATETRLYREDGIDVKTQYIYVKFQLMGKDNDAGTLLREKLLKDDSTLNMMNLAEINGYKTYTSKDGEKTIGLIDKDSNPGNLNLQKISALTQSNLKDLKFEDDENDAPALIYKLTRSKTLEGIVFEDVTRNNLLTDQSRNGDGEYKSKEGDKTIKGVIVELIEEKNNITRATTTTDENGWYGFTGFIPGDYFVRFKYGANNDTAMTKNSAFVQGQNEVSYNGQDYQSTTYTPKDNNSYWYAIDTDIRKSDAVDTQDSIDRVKKYSNEDNNVYIRNHKAEVFNSYLKEQPEHIDQDYGEILANELIKKTWREAYTEKMNIEIEYARTETNRNDSTDYNITNVDFGLVERPRSELLIDQDVAHITVKLTDKQKLFDTDITKTGMNVENILYTPPTLSSKKPDWAYVLLKGRFFDEYEKNELINPIIDEELMNGAELEVTYNITVTNNGEKGIGSTRAVNIVNYVSNNFTFDIKAGDNEKYWEVVSKDSIQTDNKATYINNASIGENKVIDLSSQSVILIAKEGNPLLEKTQPGESTKTATLTLKKVLSVGERNVYTNMTEIVEIENEQGRYDHGAVPGNQKLDLQPQEHDTSGASEYTTSEYTNGEIDSLHPQDGTIILTPPTGSDYNYYVYIAMGLAATLILAIGIVSIKKFVLDSNK